jgi:hypothetical protein
MADSIIRVNNIRELTSGQGITIPNTINSSGSNSFTGTNTFSNLIASGGSFTPYYAWFRDVKTANTAGGPFTLGAWQVRTLNTSQINTIPSASLDTVNNWFTLPSGTYFIRAFAPAYAVNRHKAKLFNFTDATDVIFGSSEFCSTTIQTFSRIEGSFTITSSKSFQIHHRCQTTVSTNGLGLESNFGVIEVYTEVYVYKIG